MDQNAEQPTDIKEVIGSVQAIVGQLSHQDATNTATNLEDGEIYQDIEIDTKPAPEKSVKDDLSVEEQTLLAIMSSNDRLKSMLESPTLKATLAQVLQAKKRHEDASFQRLERDIRNQGQSRGGIMPLEETFLADFVIGSEEFKEFVKELMDTIGGT